MRKLLIYSLTLSVFHVTLDVHVKCKIKFKLQHHTCQTCQTVRFSKVNDVWTLQVSDMATIKVAKFDGNSSENSHSFSPQSLLSGTSLANFQGFVELAIYFSFDGTVSHVTAIGFVHLQPKSEGCAILRICGRVWLHLPSVELCNRSCIESRIAANADDIGGFEWWRTAHSVWFIPTLTELNHFDHLKCA